MPESPVFWRQEVSWQFFWIRNFGERFDALRALRPKNMLFVLQGKGVSFDHFLSIVNILTNKPIRRQRQSRGWKRADSLEPSFPRLCWDTSGLFLSLLSFTCSRRLQRQLRTPPPVPQQSFQWGGTGKETLQRCSYVEEIQQATFSCHTSQLCTQC